MIIFLLFSFLFICSFGGRVALGLDYYLDRCGLGFSESILMLDGVSVLCLVMLLFCGVVALWYCGHYFGGSASGYLLGRMLFIFLSVMALLVCSHGFLSTLVMWEYLGVVSFFLILFYSNCDSLRATLITLFASRFGDVCLFGLAMLSCLGWMSSAVFISFLVLLVVLTKSACFPFVSWLLEAMRAPTPVSSLVHSSTLVAAGVWFLFRYGGGLVPLSAGLEGLLFVLCLCTILISSFCSIVFLDLKKIVALSTCNNVSWCILFFLLGEVYLGVFQLLGHGVCKCYLFIVLGDLMSGSSSCQDARGVYSSVYFGYSSPVLYSILSMSLCGVPFLGIFFSKHGLFCDALWCYSGLGYLFMVFCLFMSFVYSFRFWCLLCGFGSFGVSCYSSLFLAVFVLSLLGSILNFLSVFCLEEVVSIGFYTSFYFLFLQFVGASLGVYLYFFPVAGGFSFIGSVVWGVECFIGCFYEVCGGLRSLLLFLIYRWEAGLLSTLFDFVRICGLVLFPGWSALKFLVLSGGAVVVVSLFFS